MWAQKITAHELSGSKQDTNLRLSGPTSCVILRSTFDLLLRVFLPCKTYRNFCPLQFPHFIRTNWWHFATITGRQVALSEKSHPIKVKPRWYLLVLFLCSCWFVYIVHIHVSLVDVIPDIPLHQPTRCLHQMTSIHNQNWCFLINRTPVVETFILFTRAVLGCCLARDPHHPIIIPPEAVFSGCVYDASTHQRLTWEADGA